MYALVELHDDKYQPLADLTWHQNKVLYAEQHGYKHFCRTDNFHEGSLIGYQKMWFLKDLMTEHPEIEWFWWTGTDTMIMNFSTRLEDRVNNAYHFMVCVDVNGINADSFLIRNTQEGRKFLDRILELEAECSQHWDGEQRAVAVALGFPVTGEIVGVAADRFEIKNEWKGLVKILPQRYMNGFNYQLYHYKDHRDSLGYDGNWNFGDWLIHWPATSLEYRQQLYHFYKDHIIK
jgi:hypothetical protein